MEPSENKQSRENPLQRKAEFLDESAEVFHARMNELMAEGREFFVFRGAGTNNGIDAEEVPSAVEKVAAILRDALGSGRKLVLMFDGDDDNPEKPDIGAVFGRIADEFRDNPDVLAITAQKQAWYYPKTEVGALESATGTQYETYVVPETASLVNGDRYPALTPQTDLTQSETLAQYERYQQIFVGPAGPIAFAQLGDLNEKARGHDVKVLAVATNNNADLTLELEAKRRTLLDAGNVEKADEVAAIIQQRSNSLGALYNPDGTPVELDVYENLSITIDDSIVR